MKLDTQAHGSVSVVAPHGPLTREEVDDFRRELRTAADQRNGRVVIDMRDVAYLDSAGIEALAETCGERRTNVVRPKLAQLPETCREALDPTNVLGRLHVFDTIESAVRSYKR